MSNKCVKRIRHGLAICIYITVILMGIELVNRLSIRDREVRIKIEESTAISRTLEQLQKVDMPGAVETKNGLFYVEPIVLPEKTE